MTFSLVARAVDPASGKPLFGVAVASKFLAVGAVVPGAAVESGAIATQSMANLSYIPDGLALLAAGSSAQDAVDTLTAADAEAALRQLGIVGADGSSATFTGAGCYAWAGGQTGPGWAAQGNILVGSAVVEDMARAWELWVAEEIDARPGSTLTGAAMARGLVTALLAGDRAGGDARGRQSAAVLVVTPGGGYGGLSDVAVDLRVDDHPHPVNELFRLIDIHDMLFGSTPESELIPLEGAVASVTATSLAGVGHPPASNSPADIEAALISWAGVENLEERMRTGKIDPVVLNRLVELAQDATDPRSATGQSTSRPTDRNDS